MAEAVPMFRSKFAKRNPRQQKNHNWNHGNKTTTQRGYGYRWQKLRKVILKRDGFLCQVCKSAGKYTPADEVDHIVPKASGGSDDPDNLRAICKPCHSIKTAKESNQ